MDHTDSMREIINLGSSRTVKLLDLVNAIENSLRSGSEENLWQPGDMKQTWTKVDKAGKLLDYDSVFTIDEDLEAFSIWFLSCKVISRNTQNVNRAE